MKERDITKLKERLRSVDSKIWRIKRGLKYGMKFTAVQRKLALLYKKRNELAREIEKLEASDGQFFKTTHERR